MATSKPKPGVTRRNRVKDNRPAVRDFAAKCLRARREPRWTREQLAGLSGVSVSQIAKLEDAKGGGALETWDLLARGMGLTLAELFVEPSPLSARETAARYGRTADDVELMEAVFGVVKRLDSATLRSVLQLARLAPKRGS